MEELHDELIGFKVAKLASEKGVYLGITKNWYTRTGKLNSYTPKTPYYVVTQSALQRWLRETHNIHIQNHFIGKYAAKIKWGDGGKSLSRNVYDKNTYEEALEEALIIALNLI